MRVLRCRLRGFWETVTWDLFWTSLLDADLVVVSGHIWPEQPAWSGPLPSPNPEEWTGLVEFNISACVECGHVPSPAPWRAFYGA